MIDSFQTIGFNLNVIKPLMSNEKNMRLM